MNKLNHKISRWAAYGLLCLLPFTLTAMDNPPPPDEAMVVSYQVIDDQTVQVDFKLIENVYLYKHAFGFSGENLTVNQQALLIPVGKKKDDPNFGAVEVYYHSLSITVPVADIGNQPMLKVKYQGCIEDFICYPPQRKTFDLGGQLSKSAQNTTAQTSQQNSNFNGNVLNTGINTGSGFFGSDQQLLPVDQAFQFETIALDANQLMVRFTMAANIYLYKDQIQFNTFTDGIELGQPEFPQAQIKDDPEFGLVDVFYDVAEIVIPIKRTQAGISSLDIEAAFQGCEDDKVCYPPTAQLVSVDLPPAEAIVASTANSPSIDTNPVQLSEQGIITKSIADDSIWWTVLKFFGFGLLLSLTPCVFPMIPILSGLIVGQKDPSTAKAFTLSLIYVLAMALTYTVVGVVAGLAGTNLQALFQTPWVIISFSVVFVLLALSMFGFYDLQLPASWQSKLSKLSNKQKSGSWIGVAVMGLLSALIVGPCVAPPLAAAVIYISSVDGGPVVGGLALFAMSMGMGIPLIAIGTSAGKWMPNSGGWMNVVKSFFGVLLIGMAIWFLSRIMAEDTILMLWGLLLIATAVMWHQNAKSNGLSGWVMSMFDAFKVILLVVGVAQLIGAMAGQSDPLRPLKGVFASGGVAVEQKVEFTPIKSLADLNKQIENSTKPVFLDFYADWCIECKRMEKTTFMDAGIIGLTQQMTVLKADVTANDDVDAALMKHFGIVGPPASLFFAAEGAPLVQHNFFGYKAATDLKRTFEKILNSVN
ncbi:Cytochrome c-type biogenesis protein DsbD, protein-disulfide reductase [hydrothermal vent metagenome]|uniref:Cytochrome c-type biogenesis protein DsbD, protein-disulfide reductase n=1 Tax=hydrothermal vent metagenome TaxID=652676 RepID=A0A3B0WK84_9ZZZZ